jgi:hypothetical protein
MKPVYVTFSNVSHQRIVGDFCQHVMYQVYKEKMVVKVGHPLQRSQRMKPLFIGIILSRA